MSGMQGGRVFLFFSVSVEECAFKQRTKYGTQRWTPGGNIMMAHSDDNGDTWSEPKVASKEL
jgi:Neuraminidase (sialidase)